MVRKVIVLVVKKKLFSNSRLKAKNLQNFITEGQSFGCLQFPPKNKSTKVIIVVKSNPFLRFLEEFIA